MKCCVRSRDSMIPTVQTVFFSLVLQGDSATKNKESQCWLNQGLQAGARARSTIARGVGVLTPVEGTHWGGPVCCLWRLCAGLWTFIRKKERLIHCASSVKCVNSFSKNIFCQHALQYQQRNLFLSQNYQMNEKHSSNIFDKAKKRKRYPDHTPSLCSWRVPCNVGWPPTP